MSLSASEIIQVMEKAKELGVTQLEVEGVKITIGVGAIAPGTVISTSPPNREPVPEMKAEEIVAPTSQWTEAQENELELYWATPYYDELLAKFEAQNKPEVKLNE